ncbi:hypothetical protein ACA910_008667 [Epithemia clementina (nom. ined.)]
MISKIWLRLKDGELKLCLMERDAPPLVPWDMAAKPTRLDKQAKDSVSKHGVRVVFSGVGMEADSYIEARCAQAKNVTEGELTGSFIVATDDVLIKMAAQNAGAWCMSAGRFVNELKAIKNVIGYRVEAAMAKVNGHAIRPEKLRNTAPVTFGRKSALIVDMRNKTKTKRKREDELLLLLDDDSLNLTVEENEHGVPWWAQLPPDSNHYRSY